MKKLNVLAAFICSILVLSACSKPEGSEKAAVREKVSASEIKEATGDYTAELKEKNYDNIEISDKFKLAEPECEDLAIYQTIYSDDFTENSQTLFEHFIPQYNPEKVTSHDTGKAMVQYLEGDYFSMITAIGGFVFSEASCWNRVVYSDRIEYTDTSVVGIDDTAEFHIGSSDVSLTELAESSNQFINEFTGLVSYPNEIKPFSFSSQKLEDGTTAGIMHCRNYYKGIPVFDIPSLSDEYKKPIATITAPVCTFVEGKQVGQFTVTQCFSDYKTEESGSEIISPVNAMDLASEKLAEHLEYEAVLEELVYFPEYVGNKNGDGFIEGYKPGDIIRLTPCWVIYFDYSWWHEIFVVVNAYTGEVEFVNNAKRNIN